MSEVRCQSEGARQVQRAQGQMQEVRRGIDDPVTPPCQNPRRRFKPTPASIGAGCGPTGIQFRRGNGGAKKTQ
jgi:hypothetical protein